jgi:2-polyprenyl-3-methyl-5-hydroxy-6-metoxy-1,4-benzoquinol methylase
MIQHLRTINFNKISFRILNRGSMFVFSQAQFRQLMNIDETWKADSLLDLGAGDGQVTKMMESHFNKIYVTEQSPSMRWRLRQMHYEVLEIDDWTMKTYDVISCLNVLDRCDKPMSLLEDIRKSLNPHGGRLIIAVVLPFSPCVESGSGIAHIFHICDPGLTSMICSYL